MNIQTQIQKQKTLLIAGRSVLTQLQITCCLNVSSGPIHQRCLLHPFICGPILNTDFLFTLVLIPYHAESLTTHSPHLDRMLRDQKTLVPLLNGY